MRRLLMIERRAAPEIGGFDERGAQPVAGALVRGGQAVDAAANHEDVVCSRRQTIGIARAHEAGSIL